uniref:Uncharacterized protein n=1 Tax=Onchocerca volvulus TaxID=6282 RepID=A0A8R1Y635_ONCVO
MDANHVPFTSFLFSPLFYADFSASAYSMKERTRNDDLIIAGYYPKSLDRKTSKFLVIYAMDTITSKNRRRKEVVTDLKFYRAL